MSGLSHLDEQGRARMVDVGGKAETQRVAIALGTIRMAPATLAALRDGKVPKGDVLAVARVAGIMGAKRTAELIPLCHPLNLSSVSVDFTWDLPSGRLLIEGVARLRGQTGVEMEALTAVSLAGLTIYDMCKAADKGMRIEAVRLVRKEGGKSGTWIAEGEGTP